MTTALAPVPRRLHRWTLVLLAGLVDAVAGLAGVLTTSGALLAASWALLVVGVDVVLLAAWRSRR